MEASIHTGDAGEEVEVRFFTRIADPKYQVAPTPFFVPLNLTRAGLSGIINYLLETETPQPFDFLIKDEFLRTNLADFKENRGITKDEVLTIEYVPALKPPQFFSQYLHEDWVSCVAASNSFIISGSYDKLARVWDDQGKCLTSIKGHTGPVKTIAWLSTPENNKSFFFITGSQDHTLRTWKIIENKKQTGFNVKEQCVCRGHTEGVESVAVEPSNTRFCSGSWDKTIKIWDVESYDQEKEEEDEEEDTEKPAKKKRKTDTAPNKVVSKSHYLSLDKHSQCVSCVDWPVTEKIYSASWDHTFREWDVDSGANITVLAAENVAICLNFSAKNGLAVTGHTDNKINLWDPRIKTGTLVQQVFRSHQGFVTGVKWHPNSDTLFVSSSHDGEIKLWDIRSKIPLYSITSAHDDKVLCVDWHGADNIVSGGADGKLKIHNFSSSQI